MLSRLVFKCGNFWISAFLHIFLIKYTSQPISQCSALYLSPSLLRPSSDTAGYTSGNGIYCSRQLLWDVAVTPAPIITVEQFLTRPTIMYGCQTDRKRMEREFSCEKKTCQNVSENTLSFHCCRIHFGLPTVTLHLGKLCPQLYILSIFLLSSGI